MKNKQQTLTDTRAQIDRLDRELIQLLKERMDAVETVGTSKNDDPQAPLFDAERESQLSRSWAEEAERHGLSSYFTGRILREVLNYSRRRQEPLVAGKDNRQTGCRVGYQGVSACYSDLAIGKLFGQRGHAVVDRTGYASFAEVLDALERREIEYALLPVENSLIGSISEVNHLLVTRNVAVVDEEVWELELCLVGLPGTAVDELREVRSHPAALQQCRKFLGSLTHAVAADYFDTAGAAQAVKDANDPGIGCICSAAAAERFGLQVLRSDVADLVHNQTRFLLLAREPELPSTQQPTKTTITFAIDDRCGALTECLTVFSDHGLNLTRLESRPQPEAAWEYLFLADLAGHQDSDEVRAALHALRQSANHVRILGSYPSRAVERRKVVTRIPVKPTTRAKTTQVLHELPESGKRTVVNVSGVQVGGDNFTLILGPCAVENRLQIRDAAAMVKAHGARIMRGGAFKPRSSPYSFQGLGFEGLDLLVEAGHEYELPIVTEVLKPDDVEAIAVHADMLQVGARNMQNFALLKELGKIRRPVLLKRGMSATLKELLQAAEYIMAGGNQRVVLCERGIRTFETSTRSTLDVSAVPVLKSMTHLPVIVDPSHAAGVRHLVVPLAFAAVAAGADGLIVECHPRPVEALCDKDQALTDADLDELVAGLQPILAAQGRSL